jgi:zinc protease
MAHPQRAELERRIQRRVLPNGLEVIVVPNSGVPLVTIEAAAKNGSFTQDSSYSGLSHLYEHMFFKANRQYPDRDQFVERASELGAEFNGVTQEEVVEYYINIPKDSVEPGLKFMDEALEHPLFREDELNSERQVVIGEYDRDESQPSFKFERAMSHALWTTGWYRKDPLGDRAVILSTTPDKMRFIEDRYYVPNNMAVIVAGDVTPDRAFELATAIFGGWKRADDPFKVAPVPPTPLLKKDTAVIEEAPIGTVLLELQWDGPSARGDVPATYAADVFSDVLNQPGGKFQQHLVDSGLFQGLDVNYYTQNQVGPITIEGQTTPDKLKAALAALDSELIKVVQPGYITPDELNATKQNRIVDAMFQLERPSGFAHQLAFWWAVTGMDYFFGYVDTMAKQTPDDLRRYANKYIVGKPRVVGVLLPPGVRESLHLTQADLLRRVK